jgi:hypothetical protein
MNKILYSTKRLNIAIVVISTLLLLVILKLPFNNKPFGDITFHEESKNLALFIKGKIPFDKVVITKAPGPILFYTPAYLIAPSNSTDNQLWVYGVVFISFLVTISLILVVKIGVSFFSKEVALLSILLFFIFPMHCYYSLGIIAEGPAFFSLTLAIYGWSVAYHSPKKKSGWIFLALGLLLLILNRPNSMLLLGLGFLVILFSFLRNKLFFVEYGKKMGLVFISVAIMGFLVLQLAKIVTGNKSDTNQNSLLYYVAHQGRFQFREEPTDLRYWESDIRPDSKDYQNWSKSKAELSEIIIDNHSSYSYVYREFLINDLLKHPFWFTRQFFVKCVYGHIYVINSVSPEKFKMGLLKGSWGYWTFILFINSINLLIIAGAIIFLFKEQNLIHYWIFWGIIVSLLIFHGMTYMEPRYIFPSRVALYIISAAGLYRILFIKKIILKLSKIMFKVSKID